VLNEPRRAARQLLALGVLETFNWSSQAPMPVFEQAIPILILALNAMQHYTHAVVLCQCLAEVNYAVACKLIQDNFVSLKSEYFEFIWEIPLLELLICKCQAPFIKDSFSQKQIFTQSWGKRSKPITL
jgi:hypothetical protein